MCVAVVGGGGGGMMRVLVLEMLCAVSGSVMLAPRWDTNSILVDVLTLPFAPH